MFYKYLGTEEHNLDVIRNLKIRFSQPHALNDPFEASPLFRDLIKNNETNKDFAQRGREFIDVQLGDKIGILSLSKTKRNQLLWSYYANDHKGYVIGFHEDSKFYNSLSRTIKNPLSNPVTVLYKKKRPLIDAPDSSFWFGEDSFNYETLEKIFGQKPREWKHEEEVRFFYKLGMCVGTPLKVKDDTNYHTTLYLIDIPKEAISEIYLGARISEQARDTIRDSCLKHELNAKIYRSRLSEKNYSLEFFLDEDLDKTARCV